MNFLNLKYFTDIVEVGSISEAARRNYMAQQSMSSHLKKLENYYQTPLFERGNPLVLTDNGTRLYQTAKQVLALLEQVQTEISAQRDPRKKRLVLGLSFGGIPPFLEELLEQVRQKGGADLDLQVLNNCARQVPLPGEIELYLGLEPPGENFAEIPLLLDRIVVVVSQGLLTQVLGAKAEQAAVAVRETSNPAYLNPVPFARMDSLTLDGALTWELQKLYQGIQNLGLKTSSDMLAASLCRNGKHALITLEDYAYRAFQKDEDIRIIPLPQVRGIQLSLYHWKDRELSHNAALFVQAAKELWT
ncbi:MAG: LysR family transcriptional regulator [Oscillospiraceae bacterium]|nr:LysR family transcriptional regulator [Oscillospiraceae bacterium]